MESLGSKTDSDSKAVGSFKGQSPPPQIADEVKAKEAPSRSDNVESLVAWVSMSQEDIDDDLSRYMIISASCDKTIRLFDARTGEPWKNEDGQEHRLISRSSEGIQMEIHHDNPIRKVIRSPNGRVAISSSEDARIKLWDIESGEIVAVWKSVHKGRELYCNLTSNI